MCVSPGCTSPTHLPRPLSFVILLPLVCIVSPVPIPHAAVMTHGIALDFSSIPVEVSLSSFCFTFGDQ